MLVPEDPQTQSFRQLQSRLTRRRVAQLEPRLRIELLVLAALLAGFVFWQVRAPLAGVRHAGGPPAVLAVLTLAWVILALLTAGLVTFRHAHRLRSVPPGPSWLALSIPPAALAKHLAWDSRVVAVWMLVPAAGLAAAAIGLLPAWWLVALAGPFAWMLHQASWHGAALGERLATWRLPARPDRSRVERALVPSFARARARPLPPAGWARHPAWLALCAKDMRLTRRVPAVYRQLGVALLFWTLSFCAWRLPQVSALGPLDYFLAFVLGLMGSAALGEWLVALAGSDPFAVVRVLPLGVSTVWGARFVWALAAAGLLLAGHALVARQLSPQALRVFLVWQGGATLAIAALAVNYGVTLFPRADLAQRMLGLSLGLAVAASLMIPLMGWVVLASAILHSARRLPRWSRLEEA